MPTNPAVPAASQVKPRPPTLVETTKEPESPRPPAQERRSSLGSAIA